MNRLRRLSADEFADLRKYLLSVAVDNLHENLVARFARLDDGSDDISENSAELVQANRFPLIPG